MYCFLGNVLKSSSIRENEWFAYRCMTSALLSLMLRQTYIPESFTASPRTGNKGTYQLVFSCIILNVNYLNQAEWKDQWVHWTSLLDAYAYQIYWKMSLYLVTFRKTLLLSNKSGRVSELWCFLAQITKFLWPSLYLNAQTIWDQLLHKAIHRITIIRQQ